MREENSAWLFFRARYFHWKRKRLRNWKLLIWGWANDHIKPSSPCSRNFLFSFFSNRTEKNPKWLSVIWMWFTNLDWCCHSLRFPVHFCELTLRFKGARFGVCSCAKKEKRETKACFPFPPSLKMMVMWVVGAPFRRVTSCHCVTSLFCVNLASNLLIDFSLLSCFPQTYVFVPCVTGLENCVRRNPDAGSAKFLRFFARSCFIQAVLILMDDFLPFDASLSPHYIFQCKWYFLLIFWFVEFFLGLVEEIVSVWWNGVGLSSFCSSRWRELGKWRDWMPGTEMDETVLKSRAKIIMFELDWRLLIADHKS
jgi:hypothetical protein